MTVPLDPNNPFANVGKALVALDRDYERERLQAHCDKLNVMKWVRHSGKPYFVAQRTVDNEPQMFVDRQA